MINQRRMAWTIVSQLASDNSRVKLGRIFPGGVSTDVKRPKRQFRKAIMISLYGMSLNWRHHQQDEMDRCKLDYAQMSGNFNGNMFKIAAFGTKSTFFLFRARVEVRRNSSEVGCGHSRSVSTCLNQSELHQ